MCICIGCTLFMLVGLLVLYNKLAPQKKDKKGDADENDDEENIPMLKSEN